MNIIVCIIVFIVINALALHLLSTRRSFTLKNPLKSSATLDFTGVECFIILTLACAPINASIGRFIQLLRLILWMIFIIWGICKVRQESLYTDKNASQIIITLYTLLLCYYVLDLLRTPVPWFGFRVFMKYLTPWLILLFVPRAINNELIVHKSIQVICWVYSAIAIYFMIHFIGAGILLSPLSGLLYWPPALMDSLSIAIPAFVIAYFEFQKPKLLLVGIGMLVIIPIVGAVRTGVGAVIISCTGMALFHYRIKALPLLVITLAFTIFLFTHVESLREKSFGNNADFDISYSDFSIIQHMNNNGRELLWQSLLEKFYQPSPLMGSGIGITQSYLYHLRFDLGSNTAAATHNDYVQMLCDNGLLSCVLYLMIGLGMVVHCFFIYNSVSHSHLCRIAAFLAGSSMCGYIGAMFTDNVITYTMTTLVYPYVFYGMALGLARLPKSNSPT